MKRLIAALVISGAFAVPHAAEATTCTPTTCDSTGTPLPAPCTPTTCDSTGTPLPAPCTPTTCDSTGTPLVKQTTSTVDATNTVVKKGKAWGHYKRVTRFASR